MFNKKEEIFDNLCEKDVPISRAAWYIKVSKTLPMHVHYSMHIHKPLTHLTVDPVRAGVYVYVDPLPTYISLSTLYPFSQMTAAYSTTMTDTKLNKKKQSTDPSFGE